MNRKSSLLYGIFIVISVFPSILKGQDYNYVAGDTLYNWAKSGLNIRTEPSITATKIGKINYGETVQVLSTEGFRYNYSIEIIKSVKIGEISYPNYSSNGHWIKIHYQGDEGYVFDGYLSFLKPLNFKQGHENQILYGGMEEYIKQSYGIYKVIKDMYPEKSERHHRRTIYENGIIIEAKGSVGWYYRQIIVPEAQLKEGLLLFLLGTNYDIKRYQEENFKEDMPPRLLKKTATELEFFFGGPEGHYKLIQINHTLIIEISNGC